jgi:hypothetical protein
MTNDKSQMTDRGLVKIVRREVLSPVICGRNKRLPANVWWGEAPEWSDDFNEASDIHPAIGEVRPVSVPSRRSVAAPRLGPLFGLTVLFAG